MATWNIQAEHASKAGLDDVGFVGKTLIDYIVKQPKVNGNDIRLFGFSNGAALTNRILIENDDPRITMAVTQVCQLNDLQYGDGSFWIGGADNSYAQEKVKLQPRKVLQTTGGKDKVILAAG